MHTHIHTYTITHTYTEYQVSPTTHTTTMLPPLPPDPTRKFRSSLAAARRCIYIYVYIHTYIHIDTHILIHLLIHRQYTRFPPPHTQPPGYPPSLPRPHQEIALDLGDSMASYIGLISFINICTYIYIQIPIHLLYPPQSHQEISIEFGGSTARRITPGGAAKIAALTGGRSDQVRMRFSLYKIMVHFKDFL